MSFDRKRKQKAAENPFCQTHGAGSIVRSRTGRTRGRVFAVIGTERDKKGRLYAVICDGDARPLARPKRKSAAHLETLMPGTAVPAAFRTDEEIRRLLARHR